MTTTKKRSLAERLTSAGKAGVNNAVTRLYQELGGSGQIITVEKEVEKIVYKDRVVEKEVIKEVEKPVEKIVEVEKIVYKTPEGSTQASTEPEISDDFDMVAIFEAKRTGGK